MNRVLLLQPQPGERISGGYLYNAKMAEHGAWDLLSVDHVSKLEQVLVASAEQGYEVILVDSLWMTPEVLVALQNARRIGARLGILLHAMPSLIATAQAGRPSPKEPTEVERELLASAGLVVVPGPFYAPMLMTQDVDVIVVSPGVDASWRSPPKPRGTRCTLISVGAVTRLKGFMDVVEVLAARPSQEDYQFIVVGSLDIDPSYVDLLKARIRGLENVMLLGQRTPEATRELVSSADILVMPSYAENHPLVLLEAMAASIPSVAYAAGSAEQILGQGEQRCGLVGPVGDKEVLSRHLEQLMGDEERRFRMARACEEAARQIPSWQMSAERARALLLSDHPCNSDG